MAATDVDNRQAPPALPDYLTTPNATLGDRDATWRYGKPPDYSNTRTVYEQTKSKTHEAGSLPELVQNLVKNWEVEASFKTDLKDWRTIDRENYTFAINGGPPQSAEHMLEVGTYNAIVASNDFYCPRSSSFASSHKTFKRMMPTFAWEVLEVYSGPPQVAFRWRHWGTMKNDYVGFNDKGEKVTVKAHRGQIDIEGVTVAKVDDKVRLQKVETWFDPMEMFRQIATNGVVNREIRDPRPNGDDLEAEEEDSPANEDHADPITKASNGVNTNDLKQSATPESLSVPQPQSHDDANNAKPINHENGVSNDAVKIPPETVDPSVTNNLNEGDCIVERPDAVSTEKAHEELNRVTPAEVPTLMNQE